MMSKTRKTRSGVEVLGTELREEEQVEELEVSVEGSKPSLSWFEMRRVENGVVVRIPVSNAEFDWFRTRVHAEVVSLRERENGRELVVYYPYMSGITTIVLDLETGELARDEVNRIEMGDEEGIIWKRN